MKIFSRLFGAETEAQRFDRLCDECRSNMKRLMIGRTVVPVKKNGEWTVLVINK